MIVGLVGPACAGKKTVAQFLIDNLGFQMAPESLEYCMDNWTKNMVVIGECTELYNRPLFLLVKVDAPISARCQRSMLSLEEFVQKDELQYPNPINGQMLIWNNSTLSSLYKCILNSNIISTERLRPSWHTYFIQICDLSSRRSNCMKRRVGCVIVKDNRIIATGYNGTPRGVLNCNQGGCARCNMNTPRGKSLDTCLCLHAEENALIEAGRERIGRDSVLYCNTCPVR